MPLLLILFEKHQISIAGENMRALVMESTGIIGKATIIPSNFLCLKSEVSEKKLRKRRKDPCKVFFVKNTYV
jgi:hypothetical protein